MNLFTHAAPVIPPIPLQGENEEIATFAGGCFWCLESDFRSLPGVNNVLSGFIGGTKRDPTYEEVCAQKTGHMEAVRVYFDTTKIKYGNLLDFYWRHIDPTDPDGQFGDRGSSYRTAIFYHTDVQKQTALTSKQHLEDAGVFRKAVVTQILPATEFFPADSTHQDYARKEPLRYRAYHLASRREQFLEEQWASEEAYRFIQDADNRGFCGTCFVKPGREELKKILNPMVYRVTQEDGTELPFQNAYWNEQREGIYVDVVSGEPLFSSRDKYDSGTGWPSFTQPLEAGNIITNTDATVLLQPHSEIRSRWAGSHLGHVFQDGPAPTGKRYCVNSASLRFIPKEDLEKEGFAGYLSIFSSPSQ